MVAGLLYLACGSVKRACAVTFPRSWPNPSSSLEKTFLYFWCLSPWSLQPEDRWLLDPCARSAVSDQSYHRIPFCDLIFLPLVRSWTSPVPFLFHAIVLLLEQSNFGVVLACCSRLVAISGPVWWERGLVLVLQRPAYLWLAEGVALCSCSNLLRS